MCVLLPVSLMADRATREAQVLHCLEQVKLRKRERVRRLGARASAALALSRSGFAVRPTWVIDSRCFDAFAEQGLPRKHDLHALIKLAKTPVGEQRCARAYEELLARPLDDAIVAVLDELWDELAPQCPQGLVLRPSLAGVSLAAPLFVRHLESSTVFRSSAELVQGIHRMWASAVLAATVDRYAEAELKEVSLAVMIQGAVPETLTGLAMRMMGEAGVEEWFLGAPLKGQEGGSWRCHAHLVMPLAQGKGAPKLPEPLAALWSRLDGSALEQLSEMGERATGLLGQWPRLWFTLQDGESEQARVQLFDAHAGGRRPVSSGDDVWSELSLGSPWPAPPTRLSASLWRGVAEQTVRESLEASRCKVAEGTALIGEFYERSYLNIDALIRQMAKAPLLTPEAASYALGGAGPELLQQVVGRAAAEGSSTLKMPLRALALLTEQVSLSRDVERAEHELHQRARESVQMDFGLLPNDAMATTLAGARKLQRQVADLCCKCAAADLQINQAIWALLRRRIPDVPLCVAYMLSSGGGRGLGVSLVHALEEVAAVFRKDKAAIDRLRASSLRAVSDLPDGPARGAFGQLVGRFGDMAVGAFELGRPRWREDPSDLGDMVAMVLDYDDPERLGFQVRQARALADRELAHYEPSLSGLERRFLRLLIDRGRALKKTRALVEGSQYRVAFAVRRVVLDIDRRLQRLDSSHQPNGAFHCTTHQLLEALRSGRPELSRVIRMRATEREGLRGQPRLPISCVGLPFPQATVLQHREQFDGLGVSPGVVEGKARVLHRRIPRHLAADSVLFIRELDLALAPLIARSVAVVAETGGALSLGAELTRELAVPVVTSSPFAALRVNEGDHLRVDGDRGRWIRLSDELEAEAAP